MRGHNDLSARLDSLYSHTCPHCGGIKHGAIPVTMGLPGGDNEALSPAYEDLINKIYKGIIETGDIDKPTVLETVTKLMSGLFDGFGNTLDKIDYNSPDYEMLSHLTRNVYQFSAAKNYQEIKSLTGSLISPDNNIRSFSDFKKEAQKILNDFNVKWLQTEYNAAIAGGQMAAKWVGFEKGADEMPFLQYQTVGDSRVRDSHRLLDGIIKEITDLFWATYYPPNGWNCRCSVTQLPHKAHATPDKNITYPEIPKIFQVNLAQKRLVFPNGSPYFIGLPNDIRHAEISLQRNEVRAFAKNNLIGKAFPSSMGNVRITTTGIKEALNQNHDHEFEKNSALYRLPQLLKEGKYISSAPDDHGKPFTYHYLQISISNKKSYINIKEDNQGNKSFYSITDRLKKK